MSVTVTLGINSGELARTISMLEKVAPARLRVEMAVANFRIGEMVSGVAKKYCPVSPTKEQYVATLKGGKTKRKDFHPGQLRDSIHFRATADFAEIFVPSTVPAAQYANFIHFGNYEPGPGTRAKGPQAGPMFIARAIDATKGPTHKIYTDALERAVEGINNG